ncbi:MAG: RagB/SusD family nutrient uptake outer membrane protein [Bacteroidales bacterium]|nr:RagB/SusD family nutrient uptake outer membrane protein [Bacteroidales bacterium]
MKSLIKYMFMGVVAGSVLSACSTEDLNTQPTTSMSGTSLMDNGNAALVPLNGIYRTLFSSWSNHENFGISAWTLAAETMGDDLIMNDAGSGWFWYDGAYNVKSHYNSDDWRPYDVWNGHYTIISNANYILAAEKTMTDGASVTAAYALGQAYAIRAYGYFTIAQWYARTYKGHESEPCAPIYTEPTTPETQGKPRSTVKEVYDQAAADIAKAVEYLGKCNTARQHISHIDYATACGIQARIALVMENWELASSAAKEAIRKSGKSILRVKDFKGVNDSSKENVMWGAEIISDQAGMYASLFAHMDADAGKYGATCRKQINIELYDMMSETDDRLAWWNPNDPNNEDGGYQQEKFKFSDLQNWLGDYIWMRIEEMYLTVAEAECRMGHDKEALKWLSDLMSKRDADWTCDKTGTALGALTSDYTGSLLEEILIQRRLELWGEGMGRIMDIRRCKQGFVRTSEQGWPSSLLLQGRPTDDPESYMWVMTIPQTEFDGNVNMDSSKDQNPTDDK